MNRDRKKRQEKVAGFAEDLLDNAGESRYNVGIVNTLGFLCAFYRKARGKRAMEVVFSGLRLKIGFVGSGSERE